MKKISREQVIRRVSQAIIDSNLKLSDDVALALDKCLETENNERAISILNQFKANRAIAISEHLPLCQDTGICLMLIKLGDQVQFDFDLKLALNEAISQAYTIGNLRKSVVIDPLFRTNSGDNTPGIFHFEYVHGEQFEITIAPKGAGSENMSNLRMMTPQTPISEIEDYIYDTIVSAHGKPCPPIIVGVGIGGTFEMAALNAKKAVLEPIGEYNEDERYAEIEKRLKARINKSQIGPMGLGGDSTCLDVSIRQYASHIASLAVAVNIQCHVARHKVVKF